MGKKEAVPNRQYTTEFRQEAVRLAGSIGGNAAAKRLGVPQSTVTSWVRRARTGTLQNVPAEASPIKRPASELEAEISRLRRELANAKLDLEIVKKAAAYLPVRRQAVAGDQHRRAGGRDRAALQEPGRHRAWVPGAQERDRDRAGVCITGCRGASVPTRWRAFSR
jgi:transposase